MQNALLNRLDFDLVPSFPHSHSIVPGGGFDVKPVVAGVEETGYGFAYDPPYAPGSFTKGSTTATPKGPKCLRLRESIVNP